MQRGIATWQLSIRRTFEYILICTYSVSNVTITKLIMKIFSHDSMFILNIIYPFVSCNMISYRARIVHPILSYTPFSTFLVYAALKSIFAIETFILYPNTKMIIIKDQIG